MRRTKEQMYPLVAQWEQSGKTLKDFARENQIALACLGYWRKKRAQESTQVDAPGFFSPVEAPRNGGGLVELIFPSGARAIFYQPDVDLIRSLIR
jgi:hypothetical protein